MPTEFPARTAEFIRNYIHSVERLEILLLLAAGAQAQWTVDQVYEQIRSNLSSVAGHLQQLAAQGFLTRSKNSEPAAYEYKPATPELVKGVEDLATLYRERRVTVIERIFAEPPSPIQGFADSFRIRKDDNNG